MAGGRHLQAVGGNRVREEAGSGKKERGRGCNCGQVLITVHDVGRVSEGCHPQCWTAPVLCPLQPKGSQRRPVFSPEQLVHKPSIFLFLKLT